MAKTASKSVSKSGSNSSSSKNIASGGQVYDRTTGTWEGETKGSLGDGKNHHQGGTTKVWRDANGIIGVEQTSTPTLQKARSITTGPGNAGAANGRPITRGPGAIGATVGGRFGQSGLGDLPQGRLKEKMKPDVTSLKLGGNWWHSNPWWSDADEWEGRYAEPGEWLGGAIVMIADGAYNAMRAADAASVYHQQVVESTPRIQGGDGWSKITSAVSDWANYHSSARWGSSGNLIRTGGGF